MANQPPEPAARVAPRWPEPVWFQDAVTYQVYLRSYADSDGDGNGDIAGLRSRLGHICHLGVDAVWISPWCRSPMVDNGYDVSDYRDIDPLFGDLEQAQGLIDDLHACGLRIILDMVANHTSDRHPWFQSALRAPAGSPERDRYHFRDGRGVNGQDPPNDWPSAFGGIAWTRTTAADGTPGQWYLHLFAPQQPDLNWDNAEVRREFEAVARFWFDRGVDGLRVDAASAFAKAPGLPDAHLQPGAGFEPATWVDSPFWDVAGVHEIHRAFRRVADSYAQPRLLVGEIATNGADRFAAYLRPGELHTAFYLALTKAPWQAGAFRTVIDTALAALEPVGAPASWVLSSHDETRHLTRLAPLVSQPGGPHRDLRVGTRRARAAALLLLALPGNAYIYQGDELGLPDVELPDEARQDPIFARTKGAVPGRDGCRVPLPWSGAVPPHGFTPGQRTWLPQPADWAALCAQAQEGDPGSMLELYRAALRLRRTHFVGDGLRWDPAPDGVLRFSRPGGATCVVNMSDTPVPLTGHLLLASDPVTDGLLGPDTAAWITAEPTGPPEPDPHIET